MPRKFDQTFLGELRAKLAALPVYESASGQLTGKELITELAPELKQLAVTKKWPLSELAKKMIAEMGYPGSELALKRMLNKSVSKRQRSPRKNTGTSQVRRPSSGERAGLRPVAPPGGVPNHQTDSVGTNQGTPTVPRVIQPIDSPAVTQQPPSAFRKRKY